MRGYLAWRVAQALVTVAVVATVTFALIRLAPGDPTSWMEDGRTADAVREHVRAQFGLDRPLHEQYWRYLASLARGELGWSISKQEPVATLLARALPNTLVLMGAALALSFALGIAMGVVQASRAGSLTDRLLGRISLAFHATPDFWLALAMLLVFALWLRWFPATGTSDPLMYDSYGFWRRVADRLYHLVLPAGTLTLLLTASVARYQRAALLDVADEDYVRTARAKGLRDRGVLRHAWRNALLPVITLFGLTLPALVGGAVFIEQIFAWPGMGRLAVGALAQRDSWLLTACVVVVSAMVSVGSLVADLLHAAADPRLRRFR